MKQRTIVGALIFLILAPLVVFDIMEIVFQMVMGCFVILSSLELIKMYESESKYSLSTKIILVICPLLLFSSLLYMVNTSIDGTYNFTIPFSVVILNMMFLLSLSVLKNLDAKDVVRGIFIMLYSGFGIASLTILRSINVDFIIYLFAITTMTDIFAYFGGLAFGKHKMAPVISPKKTWEGAVSGSICGTLVASCFALFLGFTNSNIFVESITSSGTYFSYFMVIILTLCATMLAQIGDLVASKLKRTYGVKDFGKVFPGHGGVLDRFDSAIFVGMFLAAVMVLI